VVIAAGCCKLLGGPNVHDAPIVAVDDQLGWAHRRSDATQVLKRVIQLVMQVIDMPPVLADPSTVQLLDRAEEPGHWIRVVVGCAVR
jgi:hypothetical protein